MATDQVTDPAIKKKKKKIPNTKLKTRAQPKDPPIVKDHSWIFDTHAKLNAYYRQTAIVIVHCFLELIANVISMYYIIFFPILYLSFFSLSLSLSLSLLSFESCG